MLSQLISRMLILGLGTLYPAYSSYKAVRTKDVREYVKWMMYWVVFAFFTAFETVGDLFFSWVPLYYEIKIIFLLWLLAPATKGSSVLYRKFVHPYLSKNEKDIDRYLEQAQQNGVGLLRRAGQRGLQAVATGVVQSNVMTMSQSYFQQQMQHIMVSAGGDSAEQQQPPATAGEQHQQQQHALQQQVLHAAPTASQAAAFAETSMSATSATSVDSVPSSQHPPSYSVATGEPPAGTSTQSVKSEPSLADAMDSQGFVPLTPPLNRSRPATDATGSTAGTAAGAGSRRTTKPSSKASSTTSKSRTRTTASSRKPDA